MQWFGGGTAAPRRARPGLRFRAVFRPSAAVASDDLPALDFDAAARARFAEEVARTLGEPDLVVRVRACKRRLPREGGGRADSACVVADIDAAFDDAADPDDDEDTFDEEMSIYLDGMRDTLNQLAAFITDGLEVSNVRVSQNVDAPGDDDPAAVGGDDEEFLPLEAPQPEAAAGDVGDMDAVFHDYDDGSGYAPPPRAPGAPPVLGRAQLDANQARENRDPLEC